MYTHSNSYLQLYRVLRYLSCKNVKCTTVHVIVLPLRYYAWYYPTVCVYLSVLCALLIFWHWHFFLMLWLSLSRCLHDLFLWSFHRLLHSRFKCTFKSFVILVFVHLILLPLFLSHLHFDRCLVLLFSKLSMTLHRQRRPRQMHDQVHR